MLLAGAARAGQAPGAAPPDPSDHGAFELFSDGKSIGTEKFEIRVHGNQIDAQAEAVMEVEQNGRKYDVHITSNLVLDSQFQPLSYTWSQKGTQSSQINIDFHSQPARARYKTVNGQEDRRDFKLQKDVVVLDDNAIHQYQLALERYDQAKGGTQTLLAFIPQEALPGVISISFVGRDVPGASGEPRPLRHFLLATELAQINLWTDDQGRLQVVSAPDAHFQAVRKK